MPYLPNHMQVIDLFQWSRIAWLLRPVLSLARYLLRDTAEELIEDFLMMQVWLAGILAISMCLKSFVITDALADCMDALAVRAAKAHQ